MSEILTTFTAELFALQDKPYRDFQVKLIPNIDRDTVIGVRTPALRSMAKQLVKFAKTDDDVKNRVETFLSALPHRYFDENQLHAFILCEEKDIDKCLVRLEQFLPFIDNWATSDQLSPHILKKHRDKLLPCIHRWLASEHTYTVRFGIGMLMQHVLDEHFSAEYLDIVAAVQSEEYYIRMMVAWYFATALAKQYEAALPFIECHKLEPWTHNKTIQKAIESYRISPERKEYLRMLKVMGH